jgi:anti-anti-sigma factor
MNKVGDATVVTFKGARTALEEQTVQIVRSQLLNLAEQKGRKEFVADLSSVPFIAEDAFARLSTLNKKVKQAGGRLRLCSLQSGIREFCELTGVNSIYNFDQGVAAFEKEVYDLAITCFTRVIRLDPEPTWAY